MSFLPALATLTPSFSGGSTGPSGTYAAPISLGTVNFGNRGSLDIWSLAGIALIGFSVVLVVKQWKK